MTLTSLAIVALAATLAGCSASSSIGGAASAVQVLGNTINSTHTEGVLVKDTSRFVELYLAAMDKTAMPQDAAFRKAVREHVEFGSRVAMQNSNAATDAELHPLRSVPNWSWPGDKS